MMDDRTENGSMFGDCLDRLASELRQLTVSSPDTTLQDVCARLAAITPLSSAGVFRRGQDTSALEWLHLSNPATEFMTQSLETHRDELGAVLSASQAVQFGEVNSNPKDDYFVGVPAGEVNGGPVGIGMSSTRELRKEEIARLGPLGWLIGLTVENARLSRLATSSDDAGSTARLIGFIAHELRTPLTGMRGNIQLALMASRRGQHERIPARLESAISSVDDMSDLVQKLLDVSRLERGSFPANPAVTPLGATVSAAIEEFAADDKAGFPEIRFEERASPSIEHDRPLLQRAIANLIRNVGHYTERDSVMDISIAEEESMIQVLLSYSGERLSGDDLAAISTPLSSALPSSDRSDHLSLDLAFLNGVVRQHNGRIVLHSANPSPGRHTVEIQLPRTESPDVDLSANR